MATLHIPSAQHVARNWRPTPPEISNVLVRLAENPPTFNYNVLANAARDMLVYDVSAEQVKKGINRTVKRDTVRKNYLEIIDLIENHFDQVRPDFVNEVSARYFPIGQGLVIPFKPPLIYGVGGQLVFPWFMFWRSNPLTNAKLRLFVSIVSEILAQDPDLEDAKFQILDMSAPKAGKPRVLRVVEASDVRPISDELRNDMLDDFAVGFRMAQSVLAARTEAMERARAQQNQRPNDPGQQSFRF